MPFVLSKITKYKITININVYYVNYVESEKNTELNLDLSLRKILNFLNQLVQIEKYFYITS